MAAPALEAAEWAEENEQGYFSLLAETPSVEGAAVLVNRDCAALLINRAMRLRLPETGLDMRLAEIEAYFDEAGMYPSFYLTPAARPLGLRRALLHRGYRSEYRQTVMAYDRLDPSGLPVAAASAPQVQAAGHASPGSPGTARLDLIRRGFGRIGINRPERTPLPPDFQIVEADRPGLYQDWCQTFLSGFEVPKEMHRVMYEMNLRSLRQPRVTGLLGTLGGEPVATTFLFVEDGTAGIYAVSTIPAARGRGIASAMVRHALALGAAQGALRGVLQTATGGAPERLYKSLGFRSLFVAELLTRRTPLG